MNLPHGNVLSLRHTGLSVNTDPAGDPPQSTTLPPQCKHLMHRPVGVCACRRLGRSLGVLPSARLGRALVVRP